MTPRGIRNNNPGNLRIGDPWQGLASPDQMNAAQRGEKEFCVFTSPEWGIRALMRVLITYQDKHALHTIDQIINRWAPPNGKVPGTGKEYTQDTSAYAQAVSQAVGIGSHQRLDVTDYEIAFPMVKAIIRHENGAQPYDDETINEGLKLAGIEVPLKPIAESRTLKAQTTATAATVGAGIVEVLQGAQATVEPLVPYLDAAKYILLGIVLASIFVTVRARLDDRAKGKV